jgi:hypothetical protein
VEACASTRWRSEVGRALLICGRLHGATVLFSQARSDREPDTLPVRGRRKQLCPLSASPAEINAQIAVCVNLLNSLCHSANIEWIASSAASPAISASEETFEVQDWRAETHGFENRETETLIQGGSVGSESRVENECSKPSTR